ncbi:MAG: yadH [Acidobacteria bacterium]|nr:yadH [Acidobacteriota bacterium]
MPEPRPPIVELTLARMREFTREPEAIFWVFVFPLLLALSLGFAFREKPPDKIPIGIVAGPHANERLAALRASPVLLPRIVSEEEGKLALRRGKISLLVTGDATPVYRFDPTRPDARAGRIEADDALQTAAGRKSIFKSTEQHVSERGSRYIDFLVPGLLGMNLMGTGIWGVAFSVVNARMRKLLKRLVATPMRKRDYLLAHIFSRIGFLIIETVALVTFGWLVFDVSVNGSLVTFSILCITGGIAFTGIGILIASRARTIEAVSGMANLIMMPMWICSGVFFSYERFPEPVKPFIRLLPLTALNDALRLVMNDAAPLASISTQLAVLAAWAVLTFLIGLKIFRWQ